MARRRALPDEPTAADLLRAGVPADHLVCVDCGARWDGTTENAVPCCVACRDIANRLLLAWVDTVLDLARSDRPDRPSSAA